MTNRKIVPKPKNFMTQKLGSESDTILQHIFLLYDSNDNVTQTLKSQTELHQYWVIN